MPQQAYTFDKLLLMKDAGAIAASAAAQVAGVDKVIDVGPARVNAVVIVDTTAVEVDTANEVYHIEVQLSNSPTFASTNFGAAAIVRIGHSSVTFGSASSPAVGRYEALFTNEQGGVIYRYVRVYTRVAGTIAAGGVNYTAYMAELIAP